MKPLHLKVSRDPVSCRRFTACGRRVGGDEVGPDWFDTTCSDCMDTDAYRAFQRQDRISLCENSCATCGSPLPSSKGRGRPALYCGKDCRLVGGALSQLRSRLSVVVGRCTDPAWKDLRSQLWRLSNTRGTLPLQGPTAVKRGEDG